MSRLPAGKRRGRGKVVNFGDPTTFWLNVTNIGLGVVTVVCLVAVAISAFLDVRGRVMRRLL